MKGSPARAARADTARRGQRPVYVIGNAARSVEVAWSRLSPDLAPLARRLTSDQDLLDDLLQEARIRLWELDPTRFDLRVGRERHYLWRALKNRMWEVWAREMARGTGGEETTGAMGTEWMVIALASAESENADEGSRSGFAGV